MGRGVVKKSEKIASWMEDHLVVPDGRLAMTKFRVYPWQRSILERIFDRDPPLRRVIISMGRKNGKTTFAAALLLAHLCGPLARPNAQLVSAAQSREQAGLIYRSASRMAMMSPTIRHYVHVSEYAKRLTCPRLGTEYRALSADAHTAYGLSPALVIHDELGQVHGPSSELFDALETSMAAHENPLSIVISTQAPSDSDLLSVLIDAAESGSDPRTVCIRYSAPPEMDPWSDDAILSANPGVGTTCSMAELVGLRDEARSIPAREPAYRNLVLNQRVAAHSVFLDGVAWALGDGPPDPRVFDVGPVWIGLDLSAVHDLTAMAVVGEDADGVLHVRLHVWVPAAGLRERAVRDRAPYELWLRDGVIETSGSTSIDYSDVAEALRAYAERGVVAGVGYDRWRIDVLRTELARAGADVPLVPHGQGFREMAPALDQLERVVRAGMLRHGGHPLLRWAIHGASVSTDPAGNRKLDKSKSRSRIDALVALTMAVSLWSRDVRGEGGAAPVDPALVSAIEQPLVLRW